MELIYPPATVVVGGIPLTYYNGSSSYTYQLLKNLQGDVVAILNYNNSIIATYEYDAWGNIISIKNEYGNDITSSTGYFANINPIRYRGYYYDTETGFYYLKSRYYDPANARFISADSLLSIDPASGGLNLFAYCGNDPVNRVDPNGNSFVDWIVDKYKAYEEFLWDIVGNIGKGLKRTHNYIFNEDANKVLKSEHFSFYRGTPVIKVPIGNNAFTFGAIFLGDDVPIRSDAENVVKHEFGHSVQFMTEGPIRYLFNVAIPSLITFWSSDNNSYVDDNYYSFPQEYQADIFGNVVGREYANWADTVYSQYCINKYSPLIFPFIIGGRK